MAKKNNTIGKLMILVGLPASGKTTFANEYYNKKYSRYKPDEVRVVDFDRLMKNTEKSENFISTLIKKGKGGVLFACPTDKMTIILDGLFISNAVYERLISAYVEHVGVDSVEFHFWTPDVDACLWNDRGRRDVSSEASIRNLSIEFPNKKKFSEQFGIPVRVITHNIVKKPEYIFFASENGLTLENDRYLNSCSWCLGGTSWDYMGHSQSVSAEEPCDFEELDDFLLKVAPNITFLQYKKIKRECIEMKEKSSADYYSDTSDGYYSCDMAKLYDLLNEWGYIEK